MDEIEVFRKNKNEEDWTLDNKFLEENTDDVLKEHQEGRLKIVCGDTELNRDDIIALIWPER